MKAHKIVCIVCPIGCRLDVKETENGLEVEGNTCKRGPAYAEKELTNPTRVLTSTVKIKKGLLKRLPVVTNGEVSKKQLFDAMKEINKVEIEAPITVGDVIIENILDTGVDVIASRNMNRV